MVYIGLNEMELRLGAEAFQQGVHVHSVQESSGGFIGFLFNNI